MAMNSHITCNNEVPETRDKNLIIRLRHQLHNKILSVICYTFLHDTTFENGIIKK